MKKPKNTGVIIGNQPTDFFAGVNSTVIYQERLTDGNWVPFAWDDEIQYGEEDSLSCVTQSVINSIEAQEFLLTGNKVNYSKRWIAKISGTTKQGNYLYKVADTIRHFGLIPEEDYLPPDRYTFDQFYADIPEPLNSQLITKGKDWLNKWELQYEFIAVNDPNLDHHLKQSPIQVVIPGHAICGIYSPDQLMTYLDSYSPFIKRTPISNLNQAMKPVLLPKVPTNQTDLLTEDIKYGAIGASVAKLKHALHICGWLSDENSMIDFYNDALATLINNFQKANFPTYWWLSWTSPLFWEMVNNWPGKLVGPETRKIINQIISKK